MHMKKVYLGANYLKTNVARHEFFQSITRIFAAGPHYSYLSVNKLEKFLHKNETIVYPLNKTIRNQQVP